MGLIKKIARNYLFPAALRMRLDSFFIRKTRKNCCIINFHGIRKHNNAVINNRHMPVSEFEKLLVYLKSNYDIVTLKELFEIHRKKKVILRKTIALTFDDGYLNNFEIALPLLKKHNIPATFYIITKCLLEENYLAWPDIIDIIKKRHKKVVVINAHRFKYPNFYNDELAIDLPGFLKTCGDQTEPLAYQLISKHQEYLQELETSPELLRLVNAKEIKKYSKEPLIEFGSHSHSHFNLEFLDRESAQAELINSKELLEKNTGKKIVSLAFPDGSYSQETVSIAEALGYTNIVAVNYRYNEDNSHPNLLSRFTVSNSTTFESNALRLAKQFGIYGF